MLKETKKKAIILAVAGAFVATGLALPFSQNVSAAAQTKETVQQGQPSQQGQPPKMTEEMAAKAAEKLGVDKQLLLDFQAKGNDMRDLHMSMIVADASQHSLADIMKEKIAGSTWQQICQNYNLDEAKLHQSEQARMASRLATELSVEQATVTKLLADGYQPQDIVIASLLSKKADKDIQSILDMKKINNRWQDVATELNISEADMQAALKALPHGPHAMPGSHSGPEIMPPADMPAPAENAQK